MKIEMPFSYTLEGVKRKHQNWASVRCFDVASADILEIDDYTSPEAIRIEKANGNLIESFRYHDGAFWIADNTASRAFSAQHLALVGNALVTSGYRITKDEARALNATATSLLGDLGLTRYLNTYAEDCEIFELFGDNSKPISEISDGKGGLAFEVTDPEIAFREYEDEDDRDARMATVIKDMEANLICLSGQLFRRVPEPTLLAVDFPKDPDNCRWGFSHSIAKQKSAKSPRSNFYFEAFRLPLMASNHLPNFANDPYRCATDAFSITVHAPKTLTPEPLVSSLKREIRKYLMREPAFYRDSTQTIRLLCDLHDAVPSPGGEIGDLSEDTLDEAARILCRLGEGGVWQPNPAALLWIEIAENREIDIAPVSSIPINAGSPTRNP